MLKWIQMSVLLAVMPACAKVSHGSNVDVTNGKTESGYEYVVKITIDGSGTCTGTFVSSSLLLTAAHCVDSAKKVEVDGVSVSREQFFIHPEWPIDGAELTKKREARYDVALVRFPDSTFKGKEYARLLSRTPVIFEPFTIVGFGHDTIEPFDKFCKQSAISDQSGQCVVSAGERKSGATYEFKPAFTYTLPDTNGKAGHCTNHTLKAALLDKQTQFTSFVADQCGGNFRDRSYKESGVGTKRSGTNRISSLGDGTLHFEGAVSGEGTGKDSASGAGDSGGPLFIRVATSMMQAGVTHGGTLGEKNGEFVKKSTYVNLHSKAVRDWFAEITEKQNLDFPDYR